MSLWYEREEALIKVKETLKKDQKLIYDTKLMKTIDRLDYD